MDRVEIAGAPLCGVHLAGGVVESVGIGDVSGAEIGLCVDQDDFAVDAWSGVRFYGNATNLDSRALPVPEPPATGAPELPPVQD